jgi:hypothetical protein
VSILLIPGSDIIKPALATFLPSILDVGTKYFLKGESLGKAHASRTLSNSYTLWPIVNIGACSI